MIARTQSLVRRAAALSFAVLAVACSGATAPPRDPGNREMRISWAANHESGVNRSGGGYRLRIDGGPWVDLPWTAGDLAPTFCDTTMYTGSYTIQVQAYQALDPAGGTSQNFSAIATYTLNVP